MTTIVFDVKAKKVATDSRVTEDGAIVADDATKMHIRKGVMFFLCGGVGDAEELMMAYLQKKHRVRKTMEAQGLAWDGINLIELCVDSGLLTWHPVVSDRGAYGSGSPFAQAGRLLPIGFGERCESARDDRPRPAASHGTDVSRIPKRRVHGRAKPRRHDATRGFIQRR
jgi:hypothetical protein